MLPRLVCGSLLLALATGLGAQARLHPLFQDHMVLQRDQQVPVWGEAAPGEQVTVEFAGQKLTTKAGADGRWSVALAPLKVGKPRRLVVTASNRLVLEDVLVGEVWLCSGQSNMAWPLPRARNAKAEIAAASHPQIRLFQVPRLVSKAPVARPKGGSWRV
ncbi:MAG: sialate O-acetylesterase, partial [Planctomycetota bacterium]